MTESTFPDATYIEQLKHSRDQAMERSFSITAAILLVMYVVLGLIHAVRYRNTKSTYHLLFTIGFALAAVCCIVLLIPFHVAALYSVFTLDFISGTINSMVPCLMLRQWCGSMQGALNRNLQVARLLAILGIFLCVVWHALLLVGSILPVATGFVSSRRELALHTSVENYFVLSGHNVELVAGLALMSVSLALLSKLPKSTTIGEQAKERQIKLIATLFGLLACHGLFAVIVGYIPVANFLGLIAIVAYYVVCLYPRQALVGIGETSEQLDCKLAPNNPSAAYVRPTAPPMSRPITTKMPMPASGVVSTPVSTNHA